MKTLKPLFAVALLICIAFSASSQTSFYDLKATTLDGGEFNFSKLKGKKVLIVNTASECGYTPQYEDLEKLYKVYKDSGLVIIGFPANDFGKQEPGTNEEIYEFCTKTYGVTFLMMEKISIKGNDIHPVYKWLTQKALNGKMDATVKWNFYKFMIDENGNLVDVAGSSDKPLGGKIEDWLKK